MLFQRAVLSVLFGLALAGSPACGDDHHDDGDYPHDEELTEACQAIVDACHDVDTGEGEIGECHDFAHDNADAECVSEQDRCIGVCEAAAADGGHHGDDDGGPEGDNHSS